MQKTFRASTLVPRGFIEEEATSDEAGTVIAIRALVRTVTITPIEGDVPLQVEAR